MNSGLWIITLLVLYLVAGRLLKRVGAYEVYERMGNSESLWYFMLAAAFVLLFT